MRGDEAAVVESFAKWLTDQGWRVRTELPDYLDILAERNGERLYCEAKGQTTEPGIDADIGYGQLLRRMLSYDDPNVRFALVIRDEPRSVRAVLRVAARIRDLLHISLYAVSSSGGVRELR